MVAKQCIVVRLRAVQRRLLFSWRHMEGSTWHLRWTPVKYPGPSEAGHRRAFRRLLDGGVGLAGTSWCPRTFLYRACSVLAAPGQGTRQRHLELLSADGCPTDEPFVGIGTCAGLSTLAAKFPSRWAPSHLRRERGPSVLSGRPVCGVGEESPAVSSAS